MLMSNSEILRSGFNIDYYSKRLIQNCEYYLGRTITSFEDDTSKEAKKRLAWIIFESQTKESIQSKILGLKITDRISDKVKIQVLRYLNCIMTFLGELGECLFLDTCMNNSLVNMKCINIASFEKDIDVRNPDILYDDYIPFSTSLKKIIFPSNGGIFVSDSDHNNPKDKQRDIGWCLRDNHLSQLEVIQKGERDGRYLEYKDMAKIQIKVTTNCNNINVNQYPFTPIIIFDLCNDGEYFKSIHKDKIIYTMREIFNNAETEIEYYFKILAAYATGYVDHIDIKDYEISESLELQSLFLMPLTQLRSVSPNNYDKLMDLIQNKKPSIIIGV